MLGDQALEPHAAGRLEQLRPDLALLEGLNEDPLGPAAEQLPRFALRRRSGSRHRHSVSPFVSVSNRQLNGSVSHLVLAATPSGSFRLCR